MSVHVSNEIIKSEWTDYNKHLNMAYYVLIFDKAWEVILEKFKMGEHSAKSSGMSTMVVETNTTYDSEVKEGDEVEDCYLNTILLCVEGFKCESLYFLIFIL